MECANDKVTVLHTIYDDVKAITNEVYAIRTGKNKFGVIYGDHVESPNYTSAIYRDNYVILGNDDRYMPYNAKQSGINKDGVVVVFKSNKSYKIVGMASSYMEHSSTNYRILEVKNTEENTIVVDTLTGREIYVIPSGSTVVRRFYDKNVIMGIKTQDGSVIGITPDFEAKPVSDIVKEKFGEFTLKGVKYKVKDTDGKDIILTEFGQMY